MGSIAEAEREEVILCLFRAYADPGNPVHEEVDGEEQRLNNHFVVVQGYERANLGGA